MEAATVPPPVPCETPKEHRSKSVRVIDIPSARQSFSTSSRSSSPRSPRSPFRSRQTIGGVPRRSKLGSLLRARSTEKSTSISTLKKLGVVESAKLLQSVVQVPGQTDVYATATADDSDDDESVAVQMTKHQLRKLRELLSIIVGLENKQDDRDVADTIVEAIANSFDSKNSDSALFDGKGVEEDAAIINHFIGEYSQTTVASSGKSTKNLFRKHAKRIGLAAVLSKRLSRKRSSLGDLTNGQKKENMLKAGLKVLPGEVERALEGIELWDFDIFGLLDLVDRPLLIIGFSAIHRIGPSVLLSVSCDLETLNNFLVAIDSKYNSLEYHNSLHAADVVQTCYYFLQSGGLGEFVTDWQKICLLLAAAAHDVGHPGLNNAYLSCTSHPLALTYNDISPLENMHAATLFQVMETNESTNVLANVTSSNLKNSVRRSIIDMILATDMAHHVGHLTDLEDILESAMLLKGDSKDMGDFWLGKGGEAVLRTAIHSADVGNPAKSWETYLKWTKRIMCEFYDQADAERANNVSGRGGLFGFLNRETPIADWKFQLGFINGVVKPLYTLFASVPGLRLSECLDQLEENKAKWEEKGNAA